MKRVILLLGGLAVALCVGSAGAYFTGQAQVPENVIRAGSVSVSCEPTSSALSIDALAPGVPVDRVLTVRNDGSLAETIVITGAKKLGITAFYEALQVTATCNGTTLYSGALKDLRTAPMALDPGQATDVRFSIELPSTADNDLAGDYVKLTLYVDAEQTH